MTVNSHIGPPTATFFLQRPNGSTARPNSAAPPSLHAPIAFRSSRPRSRGRVTRRLQDRGTTTFSGCSRSLMPALRTPRTRTYASHAPRCCGTLYRCPLASNEPLNARHFSCAVKPAYCCSHRLRHCGALSPLCPAR